VVKHYEPVHLITSTLAEKQAAVAFLTDHNVTQNNITWHIQPVDNAWMRDNGPIYVSDGEGLWVQNWLFDAWGGNWGELTESRNDNEIPRYVAKHIGVPVENFNNYVLEKGNLEVNGEGVFMLNWDCQNLRNPGMSQVEHERLLKDTLGAKKIIWAYGYHPDDGTTGHIDGAARFVNKTTVIIADTNEQTELDLADDLKQQGFNIVWYPGDPNWLVGNGFVIAMGENEPEFDADLKAILKELFPNRDIHLINAQSISEGGGGIHCVTNDQPRF